ncbi:hypothetical protein QTG56_24695 (plasmid) [Rossellomorea sp. AcN35-11]|nr:hypothetical protein [Rossellomorea aquimaris]WJV31835.1 hypothetical protein QTG56_24695 [Rossellomorea sp. AcN35-11]
MEKVKLMNKLRELVHANHYASDRITINQSEIAVIMQTYGISWDELKRPSFTFSSRCKMVRTGSDLRQELEDNLKMLNLAKEKQNHSIERDMELILIGFLKGVSFIDQQLSEEFSLIADKRYGVTA